MQNIVYAVRHKGYIVELFTNIRTAQEYIDRYKNLDFSYTYERVYKNLKHLKNIPDVGSKTI